MLGFNGVKNGNGGDLSDVEIEPEELDDDSVHVLQQVSRAFSIIKVTREIGLKLKPRKSVECFVLKVCLHNVFKSHKSYNYLSLWWVEFEFESTWLFTNRFSRFYLIFRN